MFTTSSPTDPFYIQKPRKSATPMKMAGKIRKKPLTLPERAPLRAAVEQVLGEKLPHFNVPVKYVRGWRRNAPWHMVTAVYTDGSREEFRVRRSNFATMMANLNACYEVRRIEVADEWEAKDSPAPKPKPKAAPVPETPKTWSVHGYCWDGSPDGSEPWSGHETREKAISLETARLGRMYHSHAIQPDGRVFFWSLMGPPKVGSVTNPPCTIIVQDGIPRPV